MGSYLWLWFLGAGSLLTLVDAFASLGGARWLVMVVVLAGLTAAMIADARARHAKVSRISYLGAAWPATALLAAVAEGVSSSVTLPLALWVGSYLVTIVWITAILLFRAPGRDWAGVLSTYTLTLLVSMLAWEFVIAPALAASTLPADVRVRVVVEAALGLLILLLFLRLLLQSPVKPLPLVLTMVGAGILVLADGVRFLLAIDGLHGPGGPVGAARIFAWTVWGAAWLHPTASRLTKRVPSGIRRLTLLRFVPLAVFALTPPTIMAIHTARGTEFNRPVLLGGCIVVFLLVLIRFWQIAKELEGKVAEHDDLSRRLAHQAFHDPLTGLANRAWFNDRLDRVLREGDPAGLVVMLIDLDDFKLVNDIFGHGTGDELLIEVARRLAASVPPGGLVARLGGDEFVVLLEAAEPSSAGAAAAWVLAVLGEPVTLDGGPRRVGASVGAAVGRAGDDRGGLLRRADLAMYAAKARGKSTYEVFQPWMADRAPGFLPTALPDTPSGRRPPGR